MAVNFVWCANLLKLLDIVFLGLWTDSKVISLGSHLLCWFTYCVGPNPPDNPFVFNDHIFKDILGGLIDKVVTIYLFGSMLATGKQDDKHDGQSA